MQIPYIKQDLPLGIVFRALGFVADREILERICYDFEDEQVGRALGPAPPPTRPAPSLPFPPLPPSRPFPPPTEPKHTHAHALRHADASTVCYAPTHRCAFVRCCAQ